MQPGYPHYTALRRGLWDIGLGKERDWKPGMGRAVVGLLQSPWVSLAGPHKARGVEPKNSAHGCCCLPALQGQGAFASVPLFKGLGTKRMDGKDSGMGQGEEMCPVLELRRWEQD